MKTTASRPKKKASRQAGFTLMEVMVALAVVAISLMAIYRMHAQTLFMDARGRFDTTATLLARQKLADVEALEFTDFSGDSGDFGDTHPGYGWQIETETITSDSDKADGPALVRLTLTVRDEADTAFTLTTYRFMYE